MKKKVFLLLTGLILILYSVGQKSVQADTGPKPSVVVDIKGLEGQEYWVTLLAKEESTGPYSVDGIQERMEYQEKDVNTIFEKIIKLTRTQDYHFLGFTQNCTETHRFEWIYYPPEEFKIFIYLPKLNKYFISEEECSKYAFDSYYMLKVDQNELNHEKNCIVIKKGAVKRSYDYQEETGNLLARMLFTLAVEILLAMLMGFRKKKELFIILMVNVLTQVFLNVVLNEMVFLKNWQTLGYLLVEVGIVCLEGIAFVKTIGSDNSQRKIWTYAFFANLLSFGSGLMMADLLPWLF